MPALKQAIDEARGFLQDTVPSAYRYSDLDLVLYANDALALLAQHRPTLFTEARLLVLIEGPYQDPKAALGPSLGIIEFLQNEEMVALREVDVKTMDSFRPGWPGDPPGIPINVMRPEAGDKFAFYVYPPAVDGAEINVRHVAIPLYAKDTPQIDDRLVPYLPALAAYVAARAESREVEEAGPSRKTSFEADFLAAAGANKK